METALENHAYQFPRIYGTYRGELTRFLLARCGDPDLAEDVLQETFVRVLRNLNQFDPDKGDMRSWLFKIAQNTLRSENRRRHHGDERAAGDELERIFAQGPEPDELVHDAMLRERMHEFIAALPKSERDVLIACKMEECTLRETARRLDMPERTVSRKLFKALKKLRAALVKSGLRSPGP